MKPRWRPVWRDVLLLLLCATLAFGGSFTCFASSGDDDVDLPVTRPN